MEAGSWVRVVFEGCGDIEKLSLSRQTTTTTAILVRKALRRRRSTGQRYEGSQG
jgi:hypothetical protein